MELLLLSALNGIAYGLLLFMLSAGLTVSFSLLGVLNFAHASLYMLGAYLGWSLSRWMGFWPAMLLAPLLVGGLGVGFERLCLRRARRSGHLAEMLVTFGLAILLLEGVQLVWGRQPLAFEPPAMLQGPAFTLVSHPVRGWSLHAGAAGAAACGAPADAATCLPFPATRGLMVLVALAMWLSLALLLSRTRIGLVMQAALTHPEAVQALGHDVPRLYTWVFGAGAALAGLAGVIGGSTFVTEPAMAGAMGSILFVVVVVGGLGSLTGALLACLLIGVLQTLAVTFDAPLVSWLPGVLAQGWTPALQRLSLSQVAPLLPYLLMVLVLLLRPRGLLGQRDA